MGEWWENENGELHYIVDGSDYAEGLAKGYSLDDVDAAVNYANAEQRWHDLAAEDASEEVEPWPSKAPAEPAPIAETPKTIAGAVDAFVDALSDGSA